MPAPGVPLGEVKQLSGRCRECEDCVGGKRSPATRRPHSIRETPSEVVTLTVAHGYDQHESNIVTGDPCWGFNVTGHPAVSVPAGLLDGLPVGAQVVAPHGADEVAIAVARRLQAQLPLPPIHV